ncbi:MAG: hypothetical protein Q9195_007024 [Heterodermia aff. obscurata]
MAVQRLSPTGNLLRNSRLFSIPNPLVGPSDKVTLTHRNDSETATLPYPTQQALETTASSLARGDWGLKRSLPLRSTTRTSTPTIRIREVDSINHITDFESAADHVLNLRKWQEIGLPISRTQTKRMFEHRDRKPRTSVFESEYDNTQPESSGLDRKRWKYRGPWIAGQTTGEFKNYTEQNIKRLKPRFRQFLRTRLKESIAAADRGAAIADGMPLPEQSPEVDEQQLNHHIKRLRQENKAQLFKLIEEFLDLPSGSESSPAKSSEEAWTSSESGPPTTHPSAGLSYLRASGHTSNHPALGPQEHDRPIRARVLDGPHRNGSNNPIIGVGGIAIEAFGIETTTLGTTKKWQSRNSITLDQDIPGGPKIWVQPEIINVDSQGKIQVQITRADQKTIALYDPEDEEPQEPAPDPIANVSRRMPNLIDMPSRNSNFGANRSYRMNSNSNSETDRQPQRIPRSNPIERSQYFPYLADALRKGEE